MKVIKNKIIPFGYAKYINLFGVLFTKKNNLELSKKTENHEKIHTMQMKHLLYIFFYIFYFIEWILKIIPSLCHYRKNFGVLQYAYRSISFEQEAYYNQNDIDYIKHAKFFGWTKYIFKMYKFES